ncbi:MAG: hypothetical protein M0D55_01685 [Elusimicrobiota bacterium]|nr:MAG: hypothetical protein M0D55_01685 [Elusimicrobiota bacterium]
MDDLIPREEERVVRHPVFEDREHAPPVFEVVRHEDDADAGPAVQAEEGVLDPEIAQERPAEDQVGDGVHRAVREQAPLARALPLVDVVRLQSEVAEEVPEHQPPEDVHAISP